MDTQILNTIKELGFCSVPHVRNQSLADHCIRVSALLHKWNMSTDLIHAAFFHSVYGREHTQFQPPVNFNNRIGIKSLIGETAENIAYLYCAIDAQNFWKSLMYMQKDTLTIPDRFTGEKINVEPKNLIDLLHLNLANMIDHINPDDQDSFRSEELSLFVQHISLLQQEPKVEFMNLFKLDLAATC